MSTNNHRRVAYGDFQTPLVLAREVCARLACQGIRPASIVEPTCGTGSFLLASLETFSDVQRILGFEINSAHVAQARATVSAHFPGAPVEIRQSDFFRVSWFDIIAELPEPILVIGNPPWVTNAALSTLHSDNLPPKSNCDRLNGMDALTGKSNFDISEWMLRENLRWLRHKQGVLAMLCKTTVARRVLKHAWSTMPKIDSALYYLDARAHFGAAVDMGLLVMRNDCEGSVSCPVFPSLSSALPSRTVGFADDLLVADLRAYQEWSILKARTGRRWRSGIKHDCQAVFELQQQDGVLLNGLGEVVEVEPESLYPLLKGAELTAHAIPRRWVVVPNRSIHEDPRHLQAQMPKAWAYLAQRVEQVCRRKSVVHRGAFIFGVGAYTFAPWKVAVAGLHKALEFVVVPPHQGKPVLLDDTCYFLPCDSQDACKLLHELLNAPPSRAFLESLIFWDAKRPITAEILNALDLMAVARHIGKEHEAAQLLSPPTENSAGRR